LSAPAFDQLLQRLTEADARVVQGLEGIPADLEDLEAASGN
jgi:hypothetical protein